MWSASSAKSRTRYAAAQEEAKYLLTMPDSCCGNPWYDRVRALANPEEILAARDARIRAEMQEKIDALEHVVERYESYCKDLGITPVPSIMRPELQLKDRDARMRREGAMEALLKLQQMYLLDKDPQTGKYGCHGMAGLLVRLRGQIERGEVEL